MLALQLLNSPSAESFVDSDPGESAHHLGAGLQAQGANVPSLSLMGSEAQFND